MTTTLHTHAIAAILAANTPLGTRYASPLSLAFEQAERELGERIGYPALVYDGAADKDTIASLHAELAAAQARIDEMESTLRLIRRRIEAEERPGEWTSEIYQAAGKALPY
jgi:hypothetical protein